MFKRLSTPAFAILCAAMLALVLITMVLAINVGAVDLRPDWIFGILVNKISGIELFAPQWPEYAEGIVWGMRFPKVIVAACVGGGLSLVGILMQALTKNALADPYILGISSGASAGATAIILLGSLPVLGSIPVQAGAFLGAMLSAVLVFSLAGAAGRISPTKLVLSGVAVSAVFSALTNLLIFMSPDSRKVNSALFWMTGSFAGIEWVDVLPVLICVVLGAAASMFMHSGLDGLLLGEETAVTIGVNVRLMKVGIIGISALLTGVLVSISGVIGFVGLVVPHVSRTLVGTVHRRLIPFSALLGGLFLLLADMAARVVVAPAELPIGVVTAVLGAPFFLLLLRKSRYSFQ